MNKGGIGAGSASIVLVFAVLCLTIFSLITFIVAENGKALVDAEARFVVGYYNADAQAERIVAELLKTDTIPPAINGVEITTEDGLSQGFGPETEVVSFSCEIPKSSMVLFVRLIINNDRTYEILSWKMQDTAYWDTDVFLDLWVEFDW